MKYIAWTLLVLLLSFLNGCVYFNECGVSNELYHDCKEYYDADGNYIRNCPPNIVNYSDLDE